jgi:H+/Cl- antiporter ClcA
LLAQFFHVTSAERKTLLVAGAAAGMSAVFNTPMAAVLLAVELLLFELKPRSFVPVAVASCAAALLRAHLLGTGAIFLTPAHAAFADLDLVFAAGVGILTGAFSTLLSNSLYKLEDGFLKLPFHWMWWPAIGGLVVGIGGYFEPRALGVGYDVISDMLTGHMVTSAIILFFVVKLVIWIFALASGTSGGVLAPLLLFGCSIGTLVSGLSTGQQSVGVWALIGMGAIMGGMMRSPLTAIIFCFELTNDSQVFVPLLIASTAAYAFTVWAMKRSILTEKVARRGYDIFREYSVDPLERCVVKEAFTPSDVISQADLTGNIPEISPDDSCKTAADRMAMNDVGHLIVVNPGDRKKLGIVTIRDLLKARRLHVDDESTREIMFPLITARRNRA